MQLCISANQFAWELIKRTFCWLVIRTPPLPLISNMTNHVESRTERSICSSRQTMTQLWCATLWSSHPNADLHRQPEPVPFRSDRDPFHFTLPNSRCPFHFSGVLISRSGAVTTTRRARGSSLPTFAADVPRCCAALRVVPFIYLHPSLLRYPASHDGSSHKWTGFKRRVIVHARAGSY